MSVPEPVMKTMPFTAILAKIDRAAVNGTKLHLDEDHVRALVASPVYASIASQKAQEFAELWHENPHHSPTGSNSDRSGSSPEPSAENGSLPGMMKPLVHAAAERRVSHTLEKINRQSKHKKR